MDAKKTIVADAYNKYRDQLKCYVLKRVNDEEDAQDIVQFVFVRLMQNDIISSESVKSLCFTIANNLVIDYIRRHYKRQEVYAEMSIIERKRYTLTPEQIATFHDLADKERCIMRLLSPSTSRIYEMTQIQEMTIEEIAEQLHISRRTVECHQFKGRKIVRSKMRSII